MSWRDRDGMENWDLAKIPDPSGPDAAFGGGGRKWLPDWKSMAATKSEAHRWQDGQWGKYLQGLFFEGGKLPTKVKDGVKEADAMKARAVVACVMGSWDPSHEHKIAGCAWILAKYWELPTPSGGAT